MKKAEIKNTQSQAYPFGQVIIGFVGTGSIVGGLIAQLAILYIFREASFAQIGFQPLLYVGLFGLIPALSTGIVIALKQIWRTHSKSLHKTFYIGFMVSALYMGAIVSYLGIQSMIEVAVLLAFMLIIGLFGGINTTIASLIALPKSSKSRFDNDLKKDHDKYQRYILNNHQ